MFLFTLGFFKDPFVVTTVSSDPREPLRPPDCPDLATSAEASGALKAENVRSALKPKPRKALTRAWDCLRTCAGNCMAILWSGEVAPCLRSFSATRQ